MLANQPIPTVAYSSTTPMRYPSTTRPASELSNDKPPAPDQTKFYPTSFTASSSIPEKQDHTNTGCFSTLDVLFSPLFYFFSRSTPRIDPVPETTGIISTPHPVVQKPTPQDLFPELTPGNLESLISRWTTTHPGPSTHPQNVEIAALVNLVDHNCASTSDIRMLYLSLLHRKQMDASTELLASEIGLSWLSMSRANSALSEADSFVSANTQFAPGVLGIEEFEPPPGKALTTEARRLLQGCAGEWKETVMPLPSVGIKMRYRKPKYWIVSVAAVCGVGSEELDRRMEWWFSKRGGEGLFG